MAVDESFDQQVALIVGHVVQGTDNHRLGSGRNPGKGLLCRGIELHNIDRYGVLISQLSGKFRDFRDCGNMTLVKDHGQALE